MKKKMNWTTLKTKLTSANIPALKQLAKALVGFGIVAMLGLFFISEVGETFEVDSLPYNISIAIQNQINNLVTVWLPILIIASVILYAMSYVNAMG